MNTGDIGILQPIAALLLLVTLFVAAMSLRGTRLRVHAAVAFGVSTAARNMWYYLTISLVGALLTLALLRPYWGSEEITIASQGEEIVFLVDISRSMLARDVPPSRIELAKRKMKDMLKAFAARGLTNRYAISVFAGDGYTVCPMTADSAVVKQFIDIISPELEMALGSDLGAGVTTALAGFTKNRSSNARIILLSDGEDDFVDQAALISEIRDKGIRFDALGFGTTQGATVTLPNGSTILDQSRKPIITGLKEAPLQAIARAGGGSYARATLDDSDITALTQPVTLPSIASDGATSTIRSYREVGPWFALCALGVLVIAAVSRRVNPFLMVCAITFGASLPSAAQTHESLLARPADASALTQYERGDYNAATEEFSKILANSPTNRRAKQGLASALYKAGRFSESQKLFQELASSAPNGREYFQSSYNDGNALLAMGRYQEAIDAYDRALASKPNDVQAMHNRSIARALLEEQQRNKASPSPTPSPEQSSAPSPAPTQSPSDTAQQSPSPTSDESASPAASPSGTPSPQPSVTADATNTEKAQYTRSPSETPGEEQQQTSVPTPGETIDSTPQAQTPSSGTPQPTVVPDDQSTEADAWLQSLPDSPLFVARHRGRGSHKGQTW